MAGWKVTNFKNGKIQNADLWVPLDREVNRHRINWHWVKGHAGNAYNERVDRLATAAREQIAPVVTVQSVAPAANRAFLSVSCLGAPGVGAWAALIEQSGSQRGGTGGHPPT